MKKRALLLVFLLVTIAIGITAQQFGRRMLINKGGEVVASYDLPEGTDSITFVLYKICGVTALSSDELRGSVTASSNAVEEGTSVTLTATPNAGYEFVNWTVNGEEVSTENPYTATVTANTEFVANFEERELEYCTISDNSTNSQRYLPSFTLTDGVNDLEVTDAQPTTGSSWSTVRKVYNDHTSKSLTTHPGATISFKELPWVGTWMHGYVFIDYNKDGVFNNTLNSNGQTGGELVSYNFYSETDSSIGQNSKGETVGNSSYVTATSMPEWTLPLDLPSGKYRMRFNIAWNTIDPCGYANMATDGGTMVDITIRVINVAPRTISVSVNDEAMGSAYIEEEGTTTLEGHTGNVTLVAVANEGYEFVNWTLNGEVISTSVKFVDGTEGDKAYVANFVALAQYIVSVSANNEAMGVVTTTAEGEVYDKTSITLTATPNEGYEFVNWTVNGVVVSTENPYTATITANTEFVANFEERELELDYCTISGNSTHSERYLPSFTLTDGVNDLEVTDAQPATGSSWSTVRKVYNDHTSKSLTTHPGATISFKELPWVGTWMHGYVFIDYNKDGVFNNTLNSNGQTGGELVSYNFYSETDSSIGQNSKGETVGNSSYVTATSMPEWTLPLDLPSGKYRMRFNIAWNTIDPCGYANMATDGGTMVDITIRVINVAPRTISVSVNDEAMGSAYIEEEGTTTLEGQTGNVTLVAVANEGYEFVNWTLNGEVVSTKAKFVDGTEGDKAYVANFEAIPIYEVSVISADELHGTVTSIQGDVVYEGDIITLTATPNECYRFVNWTVKGEVVSTKNPYTVTVTSDIEYVANFEEGELEYCTISGNSTNSERYLHSFTLTDGVNDAVVSNIQTSIRQALYHDKTSVALETLPGATISFKELLWVGGWMHAYVFIDYNKDGVFDNTLNSNGQTGGELVSYNFYSEAGSSTAQNSMGETTADNCGVSASNMPEWTLPSYLLSGDYRMRFNIAWNTIDPCGYANMAEEGGAMVDVTIRVVSKEVAPRTISVSVNDETMGSAYIEEEGTTTLEGQTGIVTLVAVANEGYKFVNWTLNGVEVSTNKALYDITEGDKEYVANFEHVSYNGHEYVDLGLPSGIKWATCNVGATTPEEYGDYFAWGETEPKTTYNWSTYKYCNGSSTTMTKYCTSSSYGTVDNKTTLELIDDAARVNWGGDWRMPTKAEQDELRDTSNCTWAWTTQNGVNGYKVTSVVNGNSLFLPAAGYRYNDYLSSAGSYGYYWSSSLFTSRSYYAYSVYLYSSRVVLDYDYRYYGYSVRAVCE